MSDYNKDPKPVEQREYNGRRTPEPQQRNPILVRLQLYPPDRDACFARYKLLKIEAVGRADTNRE